MTRKDLVFPLTFMGMALIFVGFGSCKKSAQPSIPGPVVTAVSSPLPPVPSEKPIAAPPEGRMEPLVDTSSWETLPEIASLKGRWVGKEHGDAIPDGPGGGKIVAGGIRAEFTEKKPGSVTPWNLLIWAPAKGHMTSETVAMGCGFYETVHDDGKAAWRVAFCKGYGLSGEKSTPEKLELSVRSNNSDVLKLKVGDLIDEVLVR